MADSIGAWAVTLGANVSGFTSGLQAAAGQAQNFAGQTKGLFLGVSASWSDLKGIIAAHPIGAAVVAGAAGAVTAVEQVRSAIESLAKVASFSARFNISVPQTQAIQSAAAQRGIGTDAVNAGLTELSNRIGDARAALIRGEDSGFARTLRRLGIDVRDFVAEGRPLGDQLSEITSAIGRLGNQSDRTATAIDLFGRQGRELLPILTDGGTAISQSAERLRRWGAAITDAQAMAARSASRAMGAASAAVSAASESVWNNIAAAFAPAFEAVANGISRLVEFVQPALNEIREVFRGIDLKEFVTAVTTGVEQLKPVFDAIRDLFAELRPSIAEFFKTSIRQVTEWVPVVIRYLASTVDTIRALTPAIKFLVAGALGTVSALVDIGAFIFRAWLPVFDFVVQLGRIFTSVFAVIRTAVGGTFGEAFATVREIAVGTFTVVSEAITGMASTIRSALAAAVDFAATQAERLSTIPVVGTPFVEIANRLRGVRDALAETSAAAAQAGEGVRTGIAAAAAAKAGLGEIRPPENELLRQRAQFVEQQQGASRQGGLKDFARQMRELRELGDSGLVSPEAMGRQARTLLDQFGRGLGEVRLPPIAVEGSVEAVSTLNAARSERTDVQSEIRLILDQQLEQQRESRRLAEELLRRLREGRDFEIPAGGA